MNLNSVSFPAEKKTKTEIKFVFHFPLQLNIGWHKHKNRNRRCHLVDELKNIPQKKNTKQTNENLKD